MNINAIIKKVLAGEELTDEEKAFAKGYKEPKPEVDQKLKEIEAERDALKTERDALKTAADEAANAGKSELEKLQAKFAANEKKLADLAAERDRINGEHAALKRRNRLHELASKHGVDDTDFLDFLTGKRAVEIDDDGKAEEFFTTLKTENPRLFKTPTKPGPGNPPPKPKDDPSDATPRNKIGGIIEQLKSAPAVK